MAEPVTQPEYFVANEPALLSDRRGRTHLVVLTPGERLHNAVGYVEADALIGHPVGSRVRSSKGEVLACYRPTLEEYVLLMPRAAQIVTPKDIAIITLWADIFPGATVVEAGIGSGALSLGLLRAVGERGRVIGFELREEFANRGRKNIEAWPEPLIEHYDLRLGDVHQELGSLIDVDRLVLDLADPWETLPGAARALRPGGIVVVYLPTIRQVDQFVIAVLDDKHFANPEVIEVLVRPWVADRVRLRPEQRMVSHTAFLVRTRRRGAMREEQAAGD